MAGFSTRYSQSMALLRNWMPPDASSAVYIRPSTRYTFCPKCWNTTAISTWARTGTHSWDGSSCNKHRKELVLLTCLRSETIVQGWIHVFLFFFREAGGSTYERLAVPAWMNFSPGLAPFLGAKHAQFNVGHKNPLTLPLLCNYSTLPLNET